MNKLKKAGVLTVEQALRCYPRKYQEFARFNAGMQAGTAVLVPGRVVSYLKAPYSRKVSFSLFQSRMGNLFLKYFRISNQLY